MALHVPAPEAAALSLLTLVLPWAGCQYAREMETVLREGEKQSLGAVAQTIAASLQGRADLLYRSADAAARFAPSLGAASTSRPCRCRASRSSTATPTNGRTAPVRAGSTSTIGTDRLGILTGVHERMLYVLLDVRDDKLVFDAPRPRIRSIPSARRPRLARFRGLRRRRTPGVPRGDQRRAPCAPGASKRASRPAGRGGRAAHRRRAGGSTAGGYRVELRIPAFMLGSRFGVLVDDRDERGALAGELRHAARRRPAARAAA